MKTLLIVLPLLGIIALAYTVTANLLRVWMNHRVKMALIEQLQEEAGCLDDVHELASRLDRDTRRGRHVDHVVVGVTLAALGILSALAAWGFGGPSWITGAYFGGVVCVAVGFILTLLGLITRYLARLPVESRRK